MKWAVSVAGDHGHVHVVHHHVRFGRYGRCGRILVGKIVAC